MRRVLAGCIGLALVLVCLAHVSSGATKKPLLNIFSANLSGPPSVTRGGLAVYRVTVANNSRFPAVINGQMSGDDGNTPSTGLYLNHGGVFVRSSAPSVGVGLATGRDWQLYLPGYVRKTISFTVRITSDGSDFYFSAGAYNGDWTWADAIDSSIQG